MKLVIDTSVLIDYLRGGIIGKQLFEAIEKQNSELFIPTIVLFELFSGASSENPSVKTKIINFIQNFKRIELTEEVAMRAGQLYRQTGKHISPQDYIIAASALDLGATVVTLNRNILHKFQDWQFIMSLLINGQTLPPALIH